MDKRNIKKITSGLSFRIISGTILLLLLFGIVQGMIGYYQFTESLSGEYNESAFRTAETAATLVNGDRIQEYLDAEGDDDEYSRMAGFLDTLCQKQNVTLIYVLVPDRDDYGEFTLVISVQNKAGGYDPWPIGYRRATTNDEYRNIYRDIYENGLQRGTVLRTSDLSGKEPHITSLIPIESSKGEVTAILCVQRPMSELSSGRTRFLVREWIMTLLLAVLSSLSAYFFLRDHFVRPMKTVTDEAERFARESSRAEENVLENINSIINEIEVLAQSIDRMEKDTLENIDRITQMTAESKRISTELSIARQIQAAILPHEYFPDRKEFDIYAAMTPAKEVGGDFYDFYMIDGDHLGMVIADVAGKGVPAALFMMVAKLLIKLRVHTGGDLGDMLTDVSGTLCERNPMEMFVTVWLAVITISTGEGRAVNAGHENPVVRHENGEFELYKYRHYPPLATMEGMRYEEHSFKLLPGDCIFVYTDGVTEATDKDNEMFGEDRLVEALNKHKEFSPDKLLPAVKGEIDSFVGEAEQFDDITMLAIRYNGS